MRASIKKELKLAHDNYVKEIINTSTLHEKPKRFWSYIKGLRKDKTGVSQLKFNDQIASDAKSKAEVLSKQFQGVFTKEDLASFPSLPPCNVPIMDDIIITSEGVQKLLNNLNAKKANGPDMIPTRVLKEAAIELAPVIAFIFNQSYQCATLPADWLSANIAPVFKKGSRSIPANYRPISLTSISCKIMEHVVYSQVMGHLDNNNILVNYQHGFRSGHSCESQLINAIDIIVRSMKDKTQVDLLILDFQKAFDSVPHERLLMKLAFYGLPMQLLQWLRSWLTLRYQKVIVDGENSESVHVDSGVPQGTVLGPLMFLLYVNDIGNGVTSNIKLFADDCLLFRPISSIHDSCALQDDLDRLVSWSKDWHMSFNPTKCYVLRVSRLRSNQEFYYNISGSILKQVSDHPYLGVHLSHDMRWNKHIDIITTKATNQLNFIKRNLSKCSTDVKSMAYTTIVRPHLEFASAAWDPYTKSNIMQIEAVQRRAAREKMRFVYNCYDRYNTSVSGLIKQLGWDSLESRRTANRLNVFYNVVNNKIAINLPEDLKQPIRSTRNHHSQSFIQLSTGPNYYNNSFFPRSVREWNSLNDQIVLAPSSNAFKCKLLESLRSN